MPFVAAGAFASGALVGSAVVGSIGSAKATNTQVTNFGKGLALEEAQVLKEVTNLAQAEHFIQQQYRQRYCK